MGNQTSVQNHIDFSDLNTNYIYESKHTDARFGEIKLLKRKDTGERIFQKDFSSNSSKEFEEYIEKIKTRLPLLHPNLLKVFGYNSKKEDLFCADFFKISLFFEHFETDLEKDIYKRNAAKNLYTETELRTILDSVISAGAFLQKNQISHGDIRPFNIFITKNREYKICDNTLFQSIYNPSYFGLLDGLEAKSHYPSPQVLKHYQDKAKNSDFNPYKNDIYGLGLSVLSAANLEKLDHSYDYEKKKVKEDVIHKSLDNLRGTYSDGLINTLAAMLDVNEDHRPDFVQLDDELKGYRSELRSKANLERTLQTQRIIENQKKQESPVKSSAKPTQNANPLIIDDELDRRVRKAVEKSEEMANKSPSKYKNEVIDNCIKTYLKKDPLPQDYPLLYTISPHLTMESRFVPTLKVYSQENQAQYNVGGTGSNFYGSPEQQINYGQGQEVHPQHDIHEGVQQNLYGHENVPQTQYGQGGANNNQPYGGNIAHYDNYGATYKPNEGYSVPNNGNKLY